jgi:putative membrane protein
MNRIQMFAGLVVLGWVCTAGLLPADDKKGGGDRDFVTKASAAGLAEVNLSNLAATRAANPAVKEFARRMVVDHTQANRELLALANEKMLTVARTMDDDHQKLFKKLGSEEGANFDKDYMEAMVKDHEEAVKLFEAESKDGQDEALKKWAKKTLPTLKDHLKLARDAEKKAKGGAER